MCLCHRYLVTTFKILFVEYRPIYQISKISYSLMSALASGPTKDQFISEECCVNNFVSCKTALSLVNEEKSCLHSVVLTETFCCILEVQQNLLKAFCSSNFYKDDFCTFWKYIYKCVYVCVCVCVCVCLPSSFFLLLMTKFPNVLPSPVHQQNSVKPLGFGGGCLCLYLIGQLKVWAGKGEREKDVAKSHRVESYLGLLRQDHSLSTWGGHSPTLHQ